MTSRQLLYGFSLSSTADVSAAAAFSRLNSAAVSAWFGSNRTWRTAGGFASPCTWK